MPRGGNNEAKGQLTDSAGNQAFLAQVAGEFGAFTNAEDLILAHQASQDIALRRAGLTQVDVEATEKANGDLSKYGDKYDLADGERLDRVAVRGNALVGAIVNDETGSVRKAVVGYDDTYRAPELSPEEQSRRASVEHAAQLAAAAARLREEMNVELEEKMAELQEQMQKELEQIRGKADKDLERAQRDASEESESGGQERKAQRSQRAAPGDSGGQPKNEA